MSGQQSGLFNIFIKPFEDRKTFGTFNDTLHLNFLPAQAYNTLLHVGMRRMYDLQLRQVLSEKNNT